MNSRRASPDAGDATQRWLPWLIALGLLAGTLLLRDNSFDFSDQGVHNEQIRRFLAGDFRLHPLVTMLPGYHLVMAALAWVVGASDEMSLRWLSTLLGSVLFVAYYRMLRSSWPAAGSTERTLQLAFLPLLFPLLLVNYTDAFALTLLVVALERAQGGRVLMSALAFAAAITVRQTCLLWLPLPMLLAWQALGARDWQAQALLPGVLQALRRLWPFALVAAGFLAFVLINGGVAVGDREQHTVGLYAGNLWFCLFVFFVLALPFHVAQGPAILALLRRRPWLLLGLLALYFVYRYSFRADHPFNAPKANFWLHNRVLNAILAHAWLGFLAYLAIAWALLSLVVTRLRERGGAVVFYLLALLNLLVLPLIEPRYYLPAFAFWLAWREPLSVRNERCWVGLNLVASLLVVVAMSKAWFFP